MKKLAEDFKKLNKKSEKALENLKAPKKFFFVKSSFQNPQKVSQTLKAHQNMKIHTSL